jgi:hypothetical protein
MKQKNSNSLKSVFENKRRSYSNGRYYGVEDCPYCQKTLSEVSSKKIY